MMSILSKNYIYMIIVCLLTYSVFGDTKQEKKRIRIESDLITVVDKLGKIDIAQLIHFARQINQYQTTGEVTIETNGDKKVVILLINSTRVSPQELAQLETTDTYSLEQLKEALEQAIQVFCQLSQQQLESARGAEEYMTKIIQKWCTQRTRNDSHLLEWSKAVGNEEASIRENITDFAKFNTFCDDLKAFLQDLMYSCPKCRDQYTKIKEEWKKRAQEQQPNPNH